MRLIDGDALKKRVKESTAILSVKVLAETLINTAPTITAVSVPQWISVKDGMPENEKQVILLRRNGKVSRSEVRKIGETVRFRLYSEEDDYSPVTHWAAFPAMPLPEPPKGENDG